MFGGVRVGKWSTSLPSRGAWIEMPARQPQSARLLSLPSRGAWIEITLSKPRDALHKSLPSRGAWIEMLYRAQTNPYRVVAPLTGSVD